ncbi:MAG: RdgB/HAM1 family non-canonical purine NTP pyrophosphatase [Bacteroidales bacterium]|jgi:XTP/dITP diphosphohydrolase|nr:RdgB/HAM1 family non-canonical purine NTP pyrophosphatase [Bacteroidales bacterium]
MKQSLIFATANPHKLEEVQAMLPAHIRLRSLADIGFRGDIPETEPTLEGNALQKARYIFERFAQPCFSDDTGLETEALNGAPGVYSARYAGVTGSQAEKAQANMSKLLVALSDADNRKARFRTVIAYIDASGSAHIFEGIVNGVISESPQGATGFGYDPVFIPDGYNVSFAQMPIDEKNRISHRAKAFGQFAKWIKSIEN